MAKTETTAIGADLASSNASGVPAPPGDLQGGLPDVIADGLAVLFCGINPGLKAAASGHHFAGNGNRFWRALHLAGFTPTLLRFENDRDLLTYRCGLTTAVARPTQRADQLAADEYRSAATLLLQKIERHRPGWIAFLGKPAYSAISGQRHVAWGRQAALLGGAKVWVLPNPSGLNRAFSLDDLAGAYRALLLALD